MITAYSVWETFWSLMQNSYTIYFLTFMLFFTLLYGACAAALSKVSAFKSDKAVNSAGKVVALSISAISTLGIFLLTRGKGVDEVLRQVLSPFGIFGGLVLALIVFSMVFISYRNEDKSRSWQLGLLGAATAMVLAGSVTSSPNIMALGWAIAVIFGIIALILNLSGPGSASVAASASPAVQESAPSAPPPVTVPTSPPKAIPPSQQPEAFDDVLKKQPRSVMIEAKALKAIFGQADKFRSNNLETHGVLVGNLLKSSSGTSAVIAFAIPLPVVEADKISLTYDPRWFSIVEDICNEQFGSRDVAARVIERIKSSYSGSELNDINRLIAPMLKGAIADMLTSDDLKELKFNFGKSFSELRVIGHYHSHPIPSQRYHQNPLQPSDADIKGQYILQQQIPGAVSMIASLGPGNNQFRFNGNDAGLLFFRASNESSFSPITGFAVFCLDNDSYTWWKTHSLYDVIDMVSDYYRNPAAMQRVVQLRQLVAPLLAAEKSDAEVVSALAPQGFKQDEVAAAIEEVKPYVERQRQAQHSWYHSLITKGFPLKERLLAFIKNNDSFYQSFSIMRFYENSGNYERKSVVIERNGRAVGILVLHGNIEPHTLKLSHEIFNAGIGKLPEVKYGYGHHNIFNLYWFKARANETGEVFPSIVRLPDGTGITVPEHKRANARLKIKPTAFNDEELEAMLRQCVTAVSIRCNSEFPDKILVDGLNEPLAISLTASLNAVNYPNVVDAYRHERYKKFLAREKSNIVNKCGPLANAPGVQLNIGNDAMNRIMSSHHELSRFVQAILDGIGRYYFMSHITPP